MGKALLFSLVCITFLAAASSQQPPKKAAAPSRGASVTADDEPRAGRNGVGFPVCIQCPRPEPTDEARLKKIHAPVLLDFLVTAKGRADEIVVLRSPGYGLDEKAMGAVSEWKFKPANGRDGKPIDARVQMEVKFNIR
jgi:TonB family protein